MGAFLVKLPLYFLHSWLPKAHVEAPTAGSVLLAALLLKLGSVGVLRVSCFDFMFFVLLLGVCLFGGIVGGLCAIGQRDLKALVAYSSVSHMNFLLAVVCCGVVSGEAGAWVVMVAHGLVSRGLFYVCGVSFYGLGSRKVYFRGIVGGVMCLVVPLLVFSNFGVPPSVGF